MNHNLFSDMLHAYRMYGLSFSSEICFSHLPDAAPASKADVNIRQGDIFGHDYVPPASIQIDASPGRILLRGVKSATILVRGGNMITVEPLPNGNNGIIRQLLLGWSLGGIFHQRGMLPLHGSAICDGNNCFVFCAKSGIGKSTLTAAFLNRGFSYLDDNISVVEFREEIPFVAPGAPELRLWEDSLADLAFEHQVVGAIRPELKKLSVFARLNFRSEPARLGKIFILNRTKDSALSFVSLTGGAKFQALMENIFCVRFFANSSNRVGLFSLLQGITARVAVTEIRLPNPLPTPDALCERIIEAEMLKKRSPPRSLDFIMGEK